MKVGARDAAVYDGLHRAQSYLDHVFRDIDMQLSEMEATNVYEGFKGLGDGAC